MTTVTLLGTGTMGAGMARSMLRAGLDVRAWNRTTAKAAPLAADGATVIDSAAEAVAGADVVLTMLYDVDSVLDVLGRAAESFGPDTVLVQASTVGVDGTQAVAEFAAAHAIAMLDAPVLGTKLPAEKGALTVLASGDPAVRDRAGVVLDAIGAKTVWVGDRLGQASALKLVCNAWVGSITAATAQSVALAQALDLDPQLFLDAIAGSATDSQYAHVKGKAMMADDWTVSFELDGVRKDLGLITAAAAQNGVSTVLLESLAAAYASASDAGHGADDMAAVISTFRPAG